MKQNFQKHKVDVNQNYAKAYDLAAELVRTLTDAQSEMFLQFVTYMSESNNELTRRVEALENELSDAAKILRVHTTLRRIK